jgi:adenylate kinase
MESMNTVLLLGRPGSGKGTQTALLAERFGWQTFSSGNMFREMRESESFLGAKVREVYDQGVMLPNWFADYLLLDSLFKTDPATGIICEGFSRTVDQAKLFDEFLTWIGRPYAVFNLGVSEDEAMRRQLERTKVDARADSDTPEKIKIRFEEYTKKTAPVLEFFKEKGTLVEIDGEQTPEEIATELIEKIQVHQSRTNVTV